MGSLTLPKLPVIDFGKEDLKPGTSSWLSTCKDVLNALEEYGCFVAVYDKVPLPLYNTFFSALKDLFDLPVEAKSRNVSDLPYAGYLGNKPFAPLYEGLGIVNAVTKEGTQNFTNTMWPEGNDHFCDTVFCFTKLAAELEEMVIRMVFDGYGVDHRYESHKESSTYLFRMMKYRGPEKEEGNVGIDIHTDKYFITVLNQNQVSGLEIKTKDGQWIGYDPSPSSFVVMAGEALLGWSNDRIHAPLHRVLMTGKEARYSVVLFSRREGLTEVPEELIDDKHPLKFKPFDTVGLLRYFITDYVNEQHRIEEYAIKAFCGI